MPLPAPALAGLVATTMVLAGCLSPLVEPLDDTSAQEAVWEAAGLLEGGPLRVVRALYDFGITLVEDGRNGFTYPAQMIGSLHYPAPGQGAARDARDGGESGETRVGSDAEEPFPLVLFLHGRHGTCAMMGGRETIILPGDLVCRQTPEAIAEPVDSYTGYDYLAEALASRGYVVVSVSANDVNDRDLFGDAGALARAQLVVRTLDEVASLATVGGDPAGDELVGRVDLSRIGLMGHSRGGEGVVATVAHNLARTDGPRHDIRAVFALAPIDATRASAPGVAFATLLPYCDGDVYTLSGARTYDRTRYAWETVEAPQSQILVLGANHNFYNTVWTGDDARFRSAVADDAFCGAEDGANGFGSGRLTPEAQRRNGLTYINGFFRLHLGGEHHLAGLFDGTGPVPMAACRTGTEACPGEVLVSHMPGAGLRRVVEAAEGSEAAERNDLGGANRVTGAVEVTWCAAADCPVQPTTAIASQLRFAWEGSGAWTASLPWGQGDVRRFDALTLRVAVDFTDDRNPVGEAQDFHIVLRDDRGAEVAVRASDHGEALHYPPGEEAIRRAVLNMLRVPLDAFPGVDPSRLTEVELRFGATPTGVVQVADLAFVASAT